MKPFTRAFACALAAMAVAAPGSHAQATAFSLGISAASDGVVGKPMVLQVTGTIPVNQIQYPYWLSVEVIPATVTTTCPAGRWEGWQLANSTGGGSLVGTQQHNPDAAGNVKAPVGLTPWAPGRFLFCAYTDDGMHTTLAVGSMVLNVQGAGAPPGAAAPPPAAAPPKPASPKAPRVTRSGRKLVCNAGPGDHTYKWFVNGRQKKGATGRTLRVTRKLRGRRLSCSATTSGVTVVSRPLRLS